VTFTGYGSEANPSIYPGWTPLYFTKLYMYQQMLVECDSRNSKISGSIL